MIKGLSAYQSPSFATTRPFRAMGTPEDSLLLALAAALVTDVILLAAGGAATAALAIAPMYVLAAGLLLRYQRVNVGAVEYMAMFLSVAIFMTVVFSVLAGLTISAVVGLGYLLAVASGYAIYRLDRFKAEGPTVAPATTEVQAGAASTMECGCPVYATASFDTLERQKPPIDVGLLMGVDIFRDLSEEQVGVVARLGQVKSFRQGETLGEQGSIGNELYMILEGQVQLQTVSPIGRLTVRVAGPGESVPLAILFGSGTLVTTAVALSDLRALAIPQLQLLYLCEDRPDIGMCLFQAVAEILAARYRSTLSRMTSSMDQALQRSELWANV